tara:strand:- start:13655 stop:14392 length:738 start_codon:yes stop_codon:yes gene_type:complete
MIQNRRKINKTFVLGSTSTIAIAICIELAKRGCKEFYLLGRNEEKNKNLKKMLEQEFKVFVQTKKFDLEDEFSKIESFVFGSYDLYLICPGYLGSSTEKIKSNTEANKIIKYNYSALIPWITSITNLLSKKNYGRIWILSSVSGDRGRPSNLYYGSAKSALNTFCEGLLLIYKNSKFSIRVIKLGYVLTPMTKGKVSKYLCIKPEKVAYILMRNCDKNGFEYLPWWWKLIMLSIRIMPKGILSRL